MAMRIKRGTRTSQPRELVGIDSKNPLTRGLIGYWYPVGRSFVSAMPGLPSMVYGTSGSTVKPGAYGGLGTNAGDLAVTNPSSSVSASIAANSRFAVAAGGSLSVLVGGIPPQGTVPGQYPNILDCENANATSGWGIYCNGDQTPPMVGGYVDRSTTSSNILGPAASGTLGIFGFTFDGPNDVISFVANGAITGSSTATGVGTVTASNQPILFGGGGNPSSMTVLAIWNRKLSDAEATSFSKNPWQVLQPATAVAFTAAAAAVTGTAVWTESSDTAAIAASSTVRATSAPAEGNEVHAIAASARVSAASATAEDNESQTVSAALRVSGAVSSTEADEAHTATVSATATTTLSWTEGAETTAISAFVATPAVASLAWTEQNESQSIGSAATVAGALAWTESNDSQSLTATVTTSNTAALSWTETPDSAALVVSVAVSCALAWAEANEATAINANATLAAVAAWLEANEIAAISVLVSSAPAAGSLAWTEQDDVTAANIFVGDTSTSPGGDIPTRRRRRMSR